jgi:hypothetical protein
MEPLYWIVPTSEDLDMQIYKVAASLHDIPRKKIVLKGGGYVTRYDKKSDEIIALLRQYFKGSVCTSASYN